MVGFTAIDPVDPLIQAFDGFIRHLFEEDLETLAVPWRRGAVGRGKRHLTME